MNFNKPSGPSIVSVHNQKQQPPPLPSVPPPTTNLLHKSLTPPTLPPPPPPPPPLSNSNNNGSFSNYSSSSASSTSSQTSNYLQPKVAVSGTAPIQNNNFGNSKSDYSTCSFSTNNLNRNKFSNISNQPTTNSGSGQYQKSLQGQYQQLHNVHGHSPYQQTTNSMRNINEIVNSSKPFNLQVANTGNQDQNYTNLQQALRAATAALQKSKASTNTLTSQSNLSKSNANLSQQNYSDTKYQHQMLPSESSLSFQPYSKHQQLNTGVVDNNSKLYKNSFNLLIEKNSANDATNNENVQPKLQKQQIKVIKSNRSNSSPVNYQPMEKCHSASDYDNLETDNIDISVNLNCLTNTHSTKSNTSHSRFVSLKPADEISLLDETKGASTHNKSSSKSSPSTETDTASSFSSPSSISSTKSSSSTSANSSAVPKFFQPLPNSTSLNFNGQRSAFSSTMNLSDKKVSDFFANGSQNDIYREVGIDVGDDNNNRETEISICKPAANNIGGFFTKGIANSKQKSASIDHLNLASCFAKNQLNKILTNFNSAASTSYINRVPSKSTSSYKDEFIREQSDDDETDLTASTIPNYVAQTKNKTLNPPPNIQPYSGVLSKSLHSLVLKPQPLKPIAEQTIRLPVAIKTNSLKPNALIGSQTGSFYNQFKPFQAHQQHQLQTNGNTNFSKLLKSKCASTTNLLNDSQHLYYNMTQQKCNLGAKSVNFLAFNQRLSESSDSLENDDDDDEEEDASSSSTSENYENQFEIVVDNSSKIARLESNLSEKSNEINVLRTKLQQQTLESNNSETEKKLYEQKLADMRSHFSQQLNLFEENERALMQDRINSLQDMYNDLKSNYQRNLENEVKTVRAKLNESQSYTNKLLKELSRCSCQDSTKDRANTTTQTDAKGTETSEMSLALKRVKLENNELKFKLDTERRQFQVEKENWLLEKQKVIQYQNYLQQKSQHSSDNKNNSNYVNNNVKQLSYQHQQQHASSSTESAHTSNKEQAKKVNSNQMHFLQQKLSVQQKQKAGPVQQQQQPKSGCQSDYFKSAQLSNQAKLYHQSLLADSRSSVACNQRHNKQPNYL